MADNLAVAVDLLRGGEVFDLCVGEDWDTDTIRTCPQCNQASVTTRTASLKVLDRQLDLEVLVCRDGIEIGRALELAARHTVLSCNDSHGRGITRSSLDFKGGRDEDGIS